MKERWSQYSGSDGFAFFNTMWYLALATYLFFALLNLAALNAYVLFCECKQKKIEQSTFLEVLALELIKKYAADRPSNLQANLLAMNKAITGDTTAAQHQRGKCIQCKSYTRGICKLCKQRACKNHFKKFPICIECSDKIDENFKLPK